MRSSIWLINDEAGNYNRMSANERLEIFASAARTTTTASAAQTNRNFSGGYFELDITAVSGTTPTLDITVRGQPRIGAAYILGRLPQKTATGRDTLLLKAGAVETAAEGDYVTQGVPVPRTFDVNAVIGGTTPSFTFSVTGSLIF